MARKTGSHSDITGPRIEAAALKLFARHGFAAVSMRQIAAEVGVQAGAIYNYTADKQGLLYHLLENHMQALLSAWSAVPKSGDPAADLEAFVRFHIEYHQNRADEVFISYMELRNLNDQNFKRIESLRKTYELQLVTILEQGAAQGAFHLPGAKVTGFALIALLTGVVNWFREDGALTLPQVQNHYWALTRQMVGLRRN